jgi:hypothetical protein
MLRKEQVYNQNLGEGLVFEFKEIEDALFSTNRSAPSYSCLRICKTLDRRDLLSVFSTLSFSQCFCYHRAVYHGLSVYKIFPEVAHHMSFF